MFKKSIIRLIDEKKWDKVRDRLNELSDKDNTDQKKRSSLRSIRSLKREMSQIDMTGQNVLHHCLWNQPPLDVLESIVRYNPENVVTADNFGQTALHVAVVSKCKLVIVEKIIELSPRAVLKGDDNFLCPLHCALLIQSSIDIVATLCLAAPSTIFMLDSKGHTPLDLAKCNKAPTSVIGLLDQFSKTYLETLEKTEAQVEQLVLKGKMELPKGGITETFLIEMANESFGWKKGKASEYFKLEQPQKQKRRSRQRSVTAEAA